MELTLPLVKVRLDNSGVSLKCGRYFYVTLYIMLYIIIYDFYIILLHTFKSINNQRNFWIILYYIILYYIILYYIILLFMLISVNIGGNFFFVKKTILVSDLLIQCWLSRRYFLGVIFILSITPYFILACTSRAIYNIIRSYKLIQGEKS